MIRIILMLVFVLTVPLGAAEGLVERPQALPPVKDELGQAPWYDGEADSWKRVVPLERSIDTDEDALGTVPVFAFAMYALVIAALALLLALIWKLRAPPVDPGAARTLAQVRAGIAPLPFAVPDAGGDPEQAFQAACAAGNWSLAVIWLYAWQLTRLDGRGRLRLAAGKTNRAYLREVAKDAAIAEALGATVAVFEGSYFGRRPVDRDQVMRLTSLNQRLLGATEVVS